MRHDTPSRPSLFKTLAFAIPATVAAVAFGTFAPLSASANPP